MNINSGCVLGGTDSSKERRERFCKMILGATGKGLNLFVRVGLVFTKGALECVAKKL